MKRERSEPYKVPNRFWPLAFTFWPFLNLLGVLNAQKRSKTFMQTGRNVRRQRKVDSERSNALLSSSRSNWCFWLFLRNFSEIFIRRYFRQKRIEDDRTKYKKYLHRLLFYLSHFASGNIHIADNRNNESTNCTDFRLFVYNNKFYNKISFKQS